MLYMDGICLNAERSPRPAKTFGQSAAGVLVSSAIVQDVDWALVIGSAALAALISLAFSLAGLPDQTGIYNFSL